MPLLLSIHNETVSALAHQYNFNHAAGMLAFQLYIHHNSSFPFLNWSAFFALFYQSNHRLCEKAIIISHHITYKKNNTWFSEKNWKK